MRAAILHCRTQTMRALRENIAGFSGCRSSALAICNYSLIAVISLFFFSPVNLNAQPSADSPQAFIDVSVVGMDSPRVLGHQTVYGVTTVRNMAGGREILQLRDRVTSGALLGPTIYTAGPLLDGTPPVWEGSGVVTTPEQARQAVAEQESAGYDFLKVYDNLRQAAYDAIISAAGDARMPVAGHVPPHVGLQRALDAHPWSIEHLTGYFEWLQNDGSPFKKEEEHEAFSHPAHLLARRQALADWIDESRIPHAAALTAKAGTWNVPTLVAWLNMTPHAQLDAAWKRAAMEYATAMLREWWNSDNGYTAEVRAAKRRGDMVRAKIVMALREAGARLIVGTDTPHPFVLPRLSAHEELANFVNLGMSLHEALKAATIDAAEFMGKAGEFGVVKPRAHADLILLEANPLDDIDNTKRIVGVVIHGHWLSRDALDQGLKALSQHTSQTQ
jgi:hypothetical protein